LAASSLVALTPLFCSADAFDRLSALLNSIAPILRPAFVSLLFNVAFVLVALFPGATVRRSVHHRSVTPRFEFSGALSLSPSTLRPARRFLPSAFSSGARFSSELQDHYSPFAAVATLTHGVPSFSFSSACDFSRVIRLLARSALQQPSCLLALCF
jgi:hypothetical protein